jgi:hypothetical protein
MRMLYCSFIILLYAINIIAQISIVKYGAIAGQRCPDCMPDVSGIIQTAIDSNPGKTIFIPTGQYCLKTPVKLRHGVELVGENKSGTMIRPQYIDGFSITGDSSNNVSIKNMFIFGANDGDHIGISCDNTHYISIDNIICQSLGTAIVLSNTSETRINNVDVLIPGNPAISNGITLDRKCINNHISNCHIEATNYGIAIFQSDNSLQAEGLMITNTLIAHAGIGIYCKRILSLHVTNCVIDLNRYVAIYLINTAGMLFSNNWVYTSRGTEGYSEAICLIGSWDCHIANNNIKTESGTSAISLHNNSNNNTITGNTIEVNNANGNNAYFDATTYLNILKDNSFKNPVGCNSKYQNFGRSNKIYDNLNSDIKYE